MEDDDNGPLVRCYERLRETEQSAIATLTEVRETLARLKQEDQDRAMEEEARMKQRTARKRSAQNVMEVAEMRKCSEAFKRYDKDGGGYIGVLELKELLEEVHGRKVDDQEFTKIMKDHDANRDGRMDFSEFLVFYNYTDAQKKKHMDAQLANALSSDYQNDANVTQKIRVYGIPMKALKQYLQKEIDERSSFIQFIWAALIFCCFLFSVQWHFRFDQMYAIDHAITWDIEQNANFAFSGIVPFENGRMGHKSYHDVNSIADFWSWFQMGLVPVFWPQGWDVSEVRANTLATCSGPKDALEGFGWPASRLNGTENHGAFSPCPEGSNEFQWQQEVTNFFGGQKKVDGHYRFFFTAVGGARIRQERVPSEDCEAPYQKAVHAGKCIPDDLDYWLQPEIRRLLMMDEKFVNQAGGETQYLLSRKSQSEVRETLRDLENRMWFSPLTRRVEILFAPYHAQQRILSAIHINFVMNSAGHIQKTVDVSSIFLQPYDSGWIYFVDIVWVLLIIKLFVEESVELGKHLRQLGCYEGFQNYMQFANAVDWFSICYAAALFIYWVFYILIDLAHIREVMGQGHALTVGTWADSGVRERFFSLVDGVAEKLNLFRTLTAVYPFIIVSRFFKAFASQPRLALVTNTLAKASNDIFHFAVVFVCVFAIFTMSALVLWGGDNKYFATFPRALNTVFRIMLGDFDWEELTEIGRAQASVWFWMFMWLVNLIMLNMLLAIVMDIYGDVKSGVGSAKTLWSQTLELVRHERDVRRGNKMSFAKILQSVDPEFLDDDEDEEDVELIRVENLITEHGVKEEQADEVMREAYRLHRRETTKSDSAEQLKKASRIERKVKSMHKFMQNFGESIEMQKQSAHAMVSVDGVFEI